MYSSQASQLARVSLAKFSHTTTSSSHNGPLNWSHIFGNGDITAILESHVASRVLLKVFQGHEILEEVDLTYHTQEAARQKGNQIKPTFAVIVKSPCLAVKYPTSGNCVRRFQVKFSSDRDYYTILAILSSINCPFSESNISSTQSARRSTQWRTADSSGAYGFPFHTEVSSGPGSNDLATQSIGSRPMSSATDITSQSTIPAQHIQPNVDKTGPTAYHDPQALNQVLPPKRDLPFSKPAAKKSRKEPNTPKSVQGTRRSLTALPQGIPRAGISPIATLGPAFIPQPSQQPIASPAQPITPGPTLIPRPQTQHIPSPATTSTPGPPIIQPPRAQEPQSQGPQPRNPTEPTTTPEQILEDLHTYTTSPTATRTARLETWLCEHIQDDDFLRLCQDVEGVWKRVAFGNPRSG